MSDLYINRRFYVGSEALGEIELLARSQLTVVLAEPGAGKSSVLDFLAKRLGTRPVRASRFRSSSYVARDKALVIDAMEEVARADDSGLNDIIEKAAQGQHETVIFASRSGEWETARTKYVEECFGQDPQRAKLVPLTIPEQRRLFGHKFPGQDFEAFLRETDRFEMGALLSNPEFLIIFGTAYIESDGHFESKVQIYTSAATRLARKATTRSRPGIDLLPRYSPNEQEASLLGSFCPARRACPSARD